MHKEKYLTNGQKAAVGALVVIMAAVGTAGAIGTYNNMTTAFPGPTALGVVAAGEGATLVLAVLLGVLTTLGQSFPAAARLGLWALPVIAAVTGVVVADSGKESIVFAMVPLAMSVSAEGLGFLLRRITVYRTGVDAEAQRKSAETMQQLAYHRARAANHPDERARAASELKSWKLAAKVGAGDLTLGADLVTVQRERMTTAADDVLTAMFALPVPAARTALDSGRVSGGTAPVPQVSGPEPVEAGKAVPPLEEAVPAPEEGVTLEEIAAVAGVAKPVPGEQLSDEQITVVLRHLRYCDDPPMSYRHASHTFRLAGFKGSQERVRKAWGELVAHEDSEA